ncbi:MAG: hypothetical protein OEU94_05630 [Aquincola sp.]|nr:hypothetical protein [Aquincola sp.]MDH4288151.1 hypothetical protein [Aquincola sp.]MDH5329557.1 hypothetical protein [Aquincola sp.]
MTPRSASAAEALQEDTVPYVAHEEFREGLPGGRFRVIVDPALAQRYVVHRTRVNVIAMLAICIGAALALAGQALWGIVLVGLGIAANRLVKKQAPRIVLHLASRQAAIYAEVTSQGVMEVRRRSD